MAELDIVPVSEVEPAAVLAAINEAFGRQRGMDWYSWKHLEGPWGPSRGWVALDAGEVVGTRLFVPWRLRSPAGEHDCSRAMDGATVPRARRRGVFSALIRAEMEVLSKADRWHCLYSTSVPASREAYRKLGWTVLPPTRMRYQSPLTYTGRSRSQSTDPDPQSLCTAWDSDALQWRTDRRSGHSYATTSRGSRSYASDSGVIYRILKVKRLRTMAVLLTWGMAADCDRLAASEAMKKGCVLMLDVAGPGTGRQDSGGPGLGTDGSSISLTTFGRSAAPAVDAHRLGSWRLSQADLEGVL